MIFFPRVLGREENKRGKIKASKGLEVGERAERIKVGSIIYAPENDFS